jgi:S-adenosyl-L-methionine hydrolase (adenosine-forming)
MNTIALITDFGLVDGFVGVMKGVISTIAPESRIIDISHESTPHDVQHVAFIVWSAYKYFPAGTVFVVVVDPEVGSERRIILVEDAGGRKFIVPENGILDFILPELESPRAWHVNNKKYWLHPVSSTFHGRDIFAPVAAHLAKGVDSKSVGTPVEIVIPPSPFTDVGADTEEADGKILSTDRFGNLVTNIRPSLESVGDMRGYAVLVGDRRIGAIKRTYADSEYGEMLALVGSSGLVEISVRNSSAQQMLGLRVGDPVIIRKNRNAPAPRVEEL